MPAGAALCCDCEEARRKPSHDHSSSHPAQAPSASASIASSVHNSDSEDMTADSTPLLDAEAGARPSMMGSDALSARQQRVDERIRTLCLVVMSTAVMGLLAYYLRTILIRFVLALALRYLLAPLIDALSCRHAASCKYKLPHHLAILIALVLAAGLLLVITGVMVRSVGSFAARADQYSDRVQELFEAFLNATAKFDFLGPELGNLQNRTSSDMQHALADFAKNNLDLTHLILELLGSAAHVIENVVYVVLFLAFLLAGSAPRDGAADDVHAGAEEAIYLYIRGKVGIVLFVAVCDALILWALHVPLWHVFAIATFWLQLVPNVGLAISLILPLPLVGTWQQLLPAPTRSHLMRTCMLTPSVCASPQPMCLSPRAVHHTRSARPPFWHHWHRTCLLWAAGGRPRRQGCPRADGPRPHHLPLARVGPPLHPAVGQHLVRACAAFTRRPSVFPPRLAAKRLVLVPHHACTRLTDGAYPIASTSRLDAAVQGADGHGHGRADDGGHTHLPCGPRASTRKVAGAEAGRPRSGREGRGEGHRGAALSLILASNLGDLGAVCRALSWVVWRQEGGSGEGPKCRCFTVSLL